MNILLKQDHISLILLLLIELGIVFFIVWKQLQASEETRRKIEGFKDIIPDETKLELHETNLLMQDLKERKPAEILRDLTLYQGKKGENMSVSLIRANDHLNVHFDKILKSLNTYLLRNKGSAADFHLVKDVVERHLDAEDNDINISLPTPLYLGLLGTMLGVVVGVLFFLPSLMENQGDTSSNLSGGIIKILLGVVASMTASAFGLWLTVQNSTVHYKGAKTLVESRKNSFYTFIQTELLPVLNQNINSSLHSLQLNLGSFNQQFTQNIAELGKLMGRNYDALIAQDSTLKQLNSMDLNTLATVNAQVFAELRGSVGSLDKFNQYLYQLNDFVAMSAQLNTQVNELLGRTQQVGAVANKISSNLDKNEKLTNFLMEHFAELEDRRVLLVRGVDNVEKTLQHSFDGLQAFTKVQMAAMRTLADTEQQKMNSWVTENRAVLTNFSRTMNENVEALRKISDEQNRRLSHDLNANFGTLIRLANEQNEKKLEIPATFWDDLKKVSVQIKNRFSA
jgi:hypothetical protein